LLLISPKKEENKRSIKWNFIKICLPERSPEHSGHTTSETKWYHHVPSCCHQVTAVFYIIRVCLQKERNNKNVLKNILHMTFSNLDILALQTKSTSTWAVFRKGDTAVFLQSRVNLLPLQAGNSRTFYMNKIHIFLILTYQATKDSTCSFQRSAKQLAFTCQPFLFANWKF